MRPQFESLYLRPSQSGCHGGLVFRQTNVPSVHRNIFLVFSTVERFGRWWELPIYRTFARVLSKKRAYLRVLRRTPPATPT